MSEPIVALELRGESLSWTEAEPAINADYAFKEAYEKHLEVVFATTEALREKSFQLRYQVYCIEQAFEPLTKNPGGRETDIYDSRSLHSLLFHRPSRTAVGTVRIILPRLDERALPLPVQNICSADTIDRHDYRIPLARTAEISRFAIAKEYRRRAFARGKKTARSGEAGNAEISHVCLGLIRAFISMSRDAGITHLFAVMEPSLLRMIRCLGIYFDKLGPMVEYHGRRQPSICDIDRMLVRVHAERPDVWCILTDNGRIWPLDRWGRSPDNLSRHLDRPLWSRTRPVYPAPLKNRLPSPIKGAD